MFLPFVLGVSFLAVHSITGTAAKEEGELVKRENATLPAPVIATPSEHWEGNDGTWSTFEIHVGTPPEVFRVLPATSWQETWVVWNTVSACNSSRGVPSDCAEARGGVFTDKNSSTWRNAGEFGLGLNGLLGFGGVGNYGFDTVGLGYTNAGTTLTSQVVAEIISDQYWLGQLGLGFQTSNISGFDNPVPSFSFSLFSDGAIASKSWSYTAGAAYRLKSVFGSLIFGGYDPSRFTPNDVVFDMGPDNLRDLLVSVRQITSSTASGNTTLMSTPEFHFLDSSVAELWLPAEVCQNFEKAFGLTVDDSTGLYLLNGTTHDKLLSSNPNITFTLGNFQKDGYTVDIVLPYAAFDLNISAPIYPNGTSYYFPLKQGQNDTMYTLGRTFFQEAYVVTQYETRTFNVSQCIFDADAQSTVLALPSNMPTPSSGGVSSNGSTGGSSRLKLAGGKIAGIIIGTIIILALVGAVLLFYLRRRRRSHQPSTPLAEADGTRVEKSTSLINPYGSSERTQASAITSEMPGQSAKVEIAGNPIMHPQELEAEVPFSSINKNHGKSEVVGTRSMSGIRGMRVSGGDSSEETTEVSELTSSSQSPSSRPAELQAAGRRPTNGPPARPDGYETRETEPDTPSEISPSSPVMVRGRGGMPYITISSPVDSPVSNVTWSPRSPVKHGVMPEERQVDQSKR